MENNDIDKTAESATSQTPTVIRKQYQSKKKSTQLPAVMSVNTEQLDSESKDIIEKVISEQDVSQVKDLTYLFNINQNKKTMVRIDKLNALQDKFVDETISRITEHSDEMSTQELLAGMKTVQDILERSTDQVNGVSDTPLIQINQQDNSVNIGNAPEQPMLNRESRLKVENAVSAILNQLHVKNKTADKKDDTITVDVSQGSDTVDKAKPVDAVFEFKSANTTETDIDGDKHD